jgi:hypothetical protein
MCYGTTGSSEASGTSAVGDEDVVCLTKRTARIAKILKNCTEAIAIRIQALSLYQIDSVLACFEELNLCLFITSKSITYSPVYGRLGKRQNM